MYPLLSLFHSVVKLSANERKRLPQDDIINALPDLHDTNGNTIPKMVEYGS